jgi:signal transduction histidine kinase
MKKPIILVIDDEKGPRESLRILLKTQYQVFCADSVEMGLDLLRESEIDLVFLDIKMPRFDGIEALKLIREMNSYVSVVMLTGFASFETAQEALRLGANDYLKKPFDIREVENVVHRTCQRTQLLRRRDHAVHEIKQLNEQLLVESEKKEKMVKLGQMTTELIHDLNTPLNVILGYTYMLFRKLEGMEHQQSSHSLEEAVTFLQAIETNVKRCSELANSWRQGRANAYSFKPFSFVEFAEELVQTTKALTLSAGVKFEGVIGLSPERQILADRVQLFRAFQNIITNSIQSLGDKKGLIRIGCREVNDTHVSLFIQDSGCGIQPEVLHQIFDPYFTTKTLGKGSGLGLFITKKIIEAHQGNIYVESCEGSGTKMEIQLPLVKNSEAETSFLSMESEFSEEVLLESAS